MANRIMLESGTDALLQEDGASFFLLEMEGLTLNTIRCMQAVKRASFYLAIVGLRVAGLFR